jgi:diphthamide synthase subunit DPH2
VNYDLHQVALQFPDELLPYAPEVYRLLQAGLGSEGTALHHHIS